MESHGLPSKIHISRKTAEQLEREGKNHWVVERKELVSAKGKGVLKTFFAEPHSDASTSTGSTDFSISPGTDLLEMDDLQSEIELRQRLIDWNVVLLSDLLKAVVAHRNAKQKSGMRNSGSSLSLEDLLSMDDSDSSGHVAKSIRDEVLDSIPIPTYEDQRKKKKKGSHSRPIEVGERVLEQLRNYVIAIEAGYPPNAFHNFAHCSHVVSTLDFRKID